MEIFITPVINAAQQVVIFFIQNITLVIALTATILVITLALLTIIYGNDIRKHQKQPLTTVASNKKPTIAIKSRR